MSTRVYFFIALAFVIGAPITVALISNWLPTEPPVEAVSEPAQPEVIEQVVDETPPEPIAAPQSSEDLIGSADPLFDPAPTLDTDAVAMQIGGDVQPVSSQGPEIEGRSDGQERDGGSDQE